MASVWLRKVKVDLKGIWYLYILKIHVFTNILKRSRQVVHKQCTYMYHMYSKKVLDAYFNNGGVDQTNQLSPLSKKLVYTLPYLNVSIP